MRYSSAILPVLVILLITSVSQAMDPPVKMWEKWYYNDHDGAEFFDIELTNSGNLFITGSVYDYTAPLLDGYSAFLMNPNGEVLWEVHHPWYTGRGLDGAVLPDGSFVITGRSVETPSDTYALFIMKISPEGSIEWTKVYDYPDTKEEGYGITCLPDGGFAVCGRVHGTGTINAGQAWLLRTDANGDTLWTREWGSTVANSPDWGKSILLNNGELCVLANGLTDALPTYGPHLLFYDLDGNYLRGTDYGGTLYYLFPADMCLASDGGYTFTTESFPPIWHTDQYGETLWWQSIYVTPNDLHKGYCIRQTMDNGYIFCGWDGYFEYEPDDEDGITGSVTQTEQMRSSNVVDYKEGWLVRFDSTGNELWNINNTVSQDNFFYSCLQLPEGGYIAGGTWSGTGYLVRYAPETGIASPDPDGSLSLEISPNPCSALLTVNFSLAEAGNASVRIYDLSGRLISTVANGLFPAGSNSVDWVVPDDASSGCYLIQYNAGLGSVTETVVLIK